ncbi:MAG: hypothetical protein IT361_11755 [Gemmatimonadaceae bacterium]|nr:hypothetical protein [Gemmatimonadaceae bacterium]
MVRLLLVFALQPQPLCAEARRFVERSGMVAVVERDTIDDWRTRQRTPGCRVTAAGATAVGIRRAAEDFYQRLRAAGWTRTPDPIDAPNEASLRFRHAAVDCLFNVYEGAVLNTEAEARAATVVEPRQGERRYHAFVMCVPAAPAAPRA